MFDKTLSEFHCQLTIDQILAQSRLTHEYSTLCPKRHTEPIQTIEPNQIQPLHRMPKTKKKHRILPKKKIKTIIKNPTKLAAAKNRIHRAAKSHLYTAHPVLIRTWHYVGHMLTNKACFK